ncbi:FAD-dependent oxidoreductase [Clostridium sp. YIM B02515]|uniref:FAD-dependent oxidoreductase n=1 Tax=Clostridium rhizosphaerae TaxID=2803861 RepID=A0ABS1TE60_9CLOT|nr:NAD(P)/FAD-dependent oxidoreductase [Clostridium rhizosphaerae]MBL4937585.1 FAD-dependent oxidoreductase [Clostridium rhizosphaerae]
MKYKNLFSKGKIGNLELKNRIVMPAMGTSLASSTGEATQELIRYYEERAKGGCGLIITEITRIDSETGVGTPNQLSAMTLNHIPQLERLARTVHKHDTKIFVQLHHPGRESHGRVINGRQIVAPSPIPCKVCQEMPRELTTAEVEDLVKKFVTGAKIAQTAGIDGVELHGAHGYLIGQFISPYTNKRTDKYGGSFMNRMRFITEIIMGIRNICGPNFPISVRISGDEFVEGGLNLEGAVKAALYLESIGVNAINVSSGLYESGYTIIEPIAFDQGWKRHLAQAVKNAVKIPVIATDVIRKPDFAESLIAEGNVDFVALGRAQLADPEWGIKAMEGRDEDIRPCISCLHCIEELEGCKTIKCAVNARMGRELEFDGMDKNGEGRTVAVIGAGPSGMESARVLATKGFKVVLFEKESELGGMLALGNKPPKKDKLTWLVEYYDIQFKKLGVEVRLNTEATLEAIKALNPYAVFVGAGSNPVVPPVEGIDRENVYNVSDILSGKIKVENEKVVILGAGMTGLETAEYLAVRNNKVTVADMLPTIGAGIYPANLATVMKNFQTHGVNMLPGHRLSKISEGFIELVNTKTNETIKVEADKVVLSLGIRSNKALVSVLEEHFDKVRVIGDADKPGRIAEAVRAGFEKAYVLE